MKVSRAREVAWRVVAGEMVVVQLDRRMMYCLNGPAASLWQAMDDPVELDRLGEVLEALATGAEQVGRAVRAFVGELLHEGLAMIDGAPAPPGYWDGGGATDPSDPRIAWRERMQGPNASCAFQPGQTPLCNQQPYNS